VDTATQLEAQKHREWAQTSGSAREEVAAAVQVGEVAAAGLLGGGADYFQRPSGGIAAGLERRSARNALQTTKRRRRGIVLLRYHSPGKRSQAVWTALSAGRRTRSG